MKKYDLIIVGSGPAGSSAAKKCAKEGLKVAVADSLFGGTCALHGCTPKRAMESVTSRYWEMHDLAGHGLASPKAVDWKELMMHKQAFTALVPANTKESFREAGMDLIEAEVSFSGKNTITNGREEYEAKNIIVATGAKPRPMDISGAEHLLTSDDFFDWPKLPKRIVFAGGGYVGFELSCIAAACGSEVTIISRDEKPMGAFDPDLVSQLVKSALAKGINVRLGFSAKKVEQKGEKYLVTISRSDRVREQVIEADMVIHSAGRVPNIQGLNLKKAGIRFSPKGIEVNEKMQSTSNASVYAVGDVNGQWPFTPVGEMEGELAAHNILHNKKRKVSHDLIPYVLYAHPKLASIGKSEKELAEEGVNFVKIQADSSGWLLEKALQNAHAGHKILVEKKEWENLRRPLAGQQGRRTHQCFCDSDAK